METSGRDRDEALADAVDAGEVEQDAPERRLGRGRRPGRGRERRGHRDRGAQAARSPRSSRCRASVEQPRLGRARREAVPLRLRRRARLARGSRSICSAVEERGVVLRAAGDLEAVALDRVGEDHRRPVGRLARAPERAEHVAEVVAAEVADERRRRRPRSSSSSRSSARALVAVERRRARVARTTSSAAPKSDWYCSFGISSIRRRSRSPPSRAYASRSRRPYLSSITSQPFVAELRLELRRADPGDDAIERLPVEVDDPEHVPEPSRQRIGERLPDVALVELGVAEQRDEAPARRGAEARLREPVRERAEQRRRRAEPDRAGRVVDRDTDPSSATDTTAARRNRAAASGTSGRAARAGTRSHAAPATRAASPRRGPRARRSAR